MQLGRGTIMAVALCAALAAPEVAVAKLKKSYAGTVATQGVQGQTPEVRLKVQFTRRNGKEVPAFIAHFQHRAIAIFCPDGRITWFGPTGEETGAIGKGFAHPSLFGDWAINKKGNFKKTLTGEYVDFIDGGDGDLFKITGKATRKVVKGTIRLVSYISSRGYSCDSGVVSWTARRTAAF